MTDSTQPSSSESAPAPAVVETTVIYKERQWVPWYFWLFAIIVVALLAVQLGHNRNVWWYVVPAVIFGALAVWILLTWSKTLVKVELDSDGSRWLTVNSATLPADVVSRSLAVPESAKNNAMGRQLDPAAFVASRGWVKEMVMLVLDDPADPTPYWLISSRNPEQLLRAFVPDQADEAIRHL